MDRTGRTDQSEGRASLEIAGIPLYSPLEIERVVLKASHDEHELT